MESQLLTIWSADTGDCLFYGRSEKIGEKDMFYQSGNFKDIYGDSSKKFVSFVRVSLEMTYRNYRRVFNGKLVCQANLSELYSSITHRADAELRRDVEQVLILRCGKNNYVGHTIINQNKVKDMHPFHTVEFNFNMIVNEETS
jgi:hypothetical protein